MTWPLTARPHQIIDIYLGDPFRLRIDGGPLQTAPETVVVGPQGSRRIQLYVSGEIHIFNILLQPAGLNRLVGIDMTSLVNEGIAARDVLGKSASLLSDAVRSATDFHLTRSRGRTLVRHDAGKRHRTGRDRPHVPSSAGNARPRAYRRPSKAIRPERAPFSASFYVTSGALSQALCANHQVRYRLTTHRNEPTKPWTRIVHEAGYFDQAHFIRECHALVGVGPSQFIGDWENIFSPDG